MKITGWTLEPCSRADEVVWVRGALPWIVGVHSHSGEGTFCVVVIKEIDDEDYPICRKRFDSRTEAERVGRWVIGRIRRDQNGWLRQQLQGLQ